MGLFPFASTIGSISNSSTEPTNARGMRVTIVHSRPLPSASCFGTARRSGGAVVRGWIHGTRGERGPTVERSPP